MVVLNDVQSACKIPQSASLITSLESVYSCLSTKTAVGLKKSFSFGEFIYNSIASSQLLVHTFNTKHSLKYDQTLCISRLEAKLGVT